MSAHVVTMPWSVNTAVVFVGAKLPSTLERNWAIVKTGGGFTVSVALALLVVRYPAELVIVTKYEPAWLVEMLTSVRVGLVAPITIFVTEVFVLGTNFHW